MKMSSTYLMLLQYIYSTYSLLNDQQRAKFGLLLGMSASVMLCTTYYKIADLAMVIKVGFLKAFYEVKMLIT